MKHSVQQVPLNSSPRSPSQVKPADRLFLFAVLSLMFMSLVVVYSASAFWSELRFQNAAYLLKSHLFKVLIGVVLIFVVARLDYHKYHKFAFQLLLVSSFLLVIAIGQRVVIKGAARFVHLGIFSFEPSELARVALLLFMAAYLADNAETIGDYRKLGRPLAWTAALSILILMQPNFSTVLMMVAVVGILFFVGGVRISHLAVLVLGAVMIAAVVMMFESYRVARVQSWLHHGSGNYQVTQSIIGFGNGGIFGVGPGNSKQRNLFLPESYGDFIYSIIGEEYGLWGSIVIMLIFLFIAFRGTAIAKRAPDRFGFLLAAGITSMISLYAFINAGVALGLFPTTGLPMPFVSYGGTAMMVNSVCAGILLNISKQIPEIVNGSEEAEPEPADERKAKGDEGGPVVGRIYS